MGEGKEGGKAGLLHSGAVVASTKMTPCETMTEEELLLATAGSALLAQGDISVVLPPLWRSSTACSLPGGPSTV